MLIAYFVIRLLKSENPRWWLAIGAAHGHRIRDQVHDGLLSPAESGRGSADSRPALSGRADGSGPEWCLALAIFLPNLIWQMRHDFISLHFLQHIHQRDVRRGPRRRIFPEINSGSALIRLPRRCGSLVCLGYLWDRRYRMLAWMYLIPLALFVVGKGRGYYLGAAYPMLLAMGAVMGERWVDQPIEGCRRRTVEGVFFTGVVRLRGS